MPDLWAGRLTDVAVVGAFHAGSSGTERAKPPAQGSVPAVGSGGQPGHRPAAPGWCHGVQHGFVPAVRPAGEGTRCGKAGMPEAWLVDVRIGDGHPPDGLADAAEWQASRGANHSRDRWLTADWYHFPLPESTRPWP